MSRGAQAAVIAAFLASFFVPINAALAGDEGEGIGGSISQPAAPQGPGPDGRPRKGGGPSPGRP